MCKYCNDVINYGSKGRVAIIDHLQSGKNTSEVDHRQSNYTLGAQFSQKSAPPALFLLFKPPPPPPKQLNPAKDFNPPPVPKLIPLVDRTANMESMILSFMAENNLSFTLAPKLVELLKECAADPIALSSVSLTLCSAAYKLTYGVSHFFKTGIIESMRTQPFLLNIDEATTANNNKKMFSILVSYFKTPKKETVMEHFASIEITKRDSLTIFQAVCDIIDSNSIPWINLQSCLMDS